LIGRSEFCSSHIGAWLSVGSKEVNSVLLVLVLAVDQNTREDDFVFEIGVISVDVMKLYGFVRVYFLELRW
jgi:hypothetical protein